MAGVVGPAEEKEVSLRHPEAPTEVRVSATRTEQRGKKQFTLYVVLVKWPDPDGAGRPAAWTVSRRFSEFAALHAALGKHLGALPALPAKTWFRSLDPGFVRRRQRELDGYLGELARMVPVLHSPAFHEFLELEEHVPHGLSTTSVRPRLTESVENVFGINDLHYEAADDIILTACEDVDLLSRLDAKLSNMRMPWDHKGEAPFTPLGSWNCYARNDQMQWEMQHVECFDSPACSIAYDALRRYIFVGLANGLVETFMADLDMTTFERVSSRKVHADRVSAITYCAKRDVLVTCGRDNLVCVLDVRQGNTLVSCGDLEKSWLSSIAYDPDGCRAMIGNWAGAVSVYDTAQSPPERLAVLEGHRGSVRCAHYDAPSRSLFTGSFDSRVGVWQIGRDGETHRSRSAGWLSGGPPNKIKAVTFAPELNVAIAGYDSGAVAVYCVMKGELLFVWDAHDRDVRTLTWAGSIRVLISGAHDGCVKFWHFVKGKRVVGIDQNGLGNDEDDAAEAEEPPAADLEDVPAFAEEALEVNAAPEEAAPAAEEAGAEAEAEEEVEAAAAAAVDEEDAAAGVEVKAQEDEEDEDEEEETPAEDDDGDIF